MPTLLEIDRLTTLAEGNATVVALQAVSPEEEPEYGQDDPRTLRAQQAYAVALKIMRSYPEALATITSVISAQEINPQLGPTHPETLKSRQIHADILYRLGRYQDAASTIDDVVSAQENVLGTQHPDTLQSLALRLSIYANLNNDTVKLTPEAYLNLQELTRTAVKLGQQQERLWEGRVVSSPTDNAEEFFARQSFLPSTLTSPSDLQRNLIDEILRLFGDTTIEEHKTQDYTDNHGESIRGETAEFLAVADQENMSPVKLRTIIDKAKAAEGEVTTRGTTGRATVVPRPEATTVSASAAPRPVTAEELLVAAEVEAREKAEGAIGEPRLKWEKDALPDEDPAHFASRAGYEHRGLIYEEDRALSVKLANWLRTHDWPKDVPYIPTKPEWNTQQIEAGKAKQAPRPRTEGQRLYDVNRVRRQRHPAS
jgi:hypothetical protein